MDFIKFKPDFNKLKHKIKLKIYEKIYRYGFLTSIFIPQNILIFLFFFIGMDSLPRFSYLVFQHRSKSVSKNKNDGTKKKCKNIINFEPLPPFRYYIYIYIKEKPCHFLKFSTIYEKKIVIS
jgi:hypothetical protein